MRIYFTRLSDIAQQDAGQGAMPQNGDAGVDGDLDLDAFLEDDEPISVAPQHPPASVTETLEDLQQQERARLQRIHERQQLRTEIFDRVLSSLGGADPNLNIPIPAPHARYVHASTATNTFLAAPETVDSPSKDDGRKDHAVERDVESSIEKEFYASISQSEAEVISSLTHVNTVRLADKDYSFNFLSVEAAKEDEETNKLWDALLPGVDVVDVRGEATELQQVLQYLVSQPAVAGRKDLKIVQAPAKDAAVAESPVVTKDVVEESKDVDATDKPTQVAITEGLSTSAAPVVGRPHHHTGSHMRGRFQAHKSEDSDDNGEEAEEDWRAARRQAKVSATTTTADRSMPSSSATVTSTTASESAVNQTADEEAPVSASAVIAPELEALDYLHAPRIMRRVVPPQPTATSQLAPSQATSAPNRGTAGNTPDYDDASPNSQSDNAAAASDVGFSVTARFIGKTYAPLQQQTAVGKQPVTLSAAIHPEQHKLLASILGDNKHGAATK